MIVNNIKYEPNGQNIVKFSTLNPAIEPNKSKIPKSRLEFLTKQFNLPTGLVYDVRLLNHDQLVEKSRDFHPEAPLRIYSIFSELEKSGCVAHMRRIPAREAADFELLYFHTQEHLDFLKSLETKTKPQLIEMTHEADSVYFSAVTEYCARLSCGGVIELLKEISLGNVRNGIAIVRPPGHHAIHNQMIYLIQFLMRGIRGFCFYNNVAVAVKKMKKTYGVKKVLILDWDVHHGNGIQDAFYSDPEVLYISLHRYGDGFYPVSGGLNECGEGAGLGKNVNIPFTSLGMGDNDYMYAFHKVVMPIAMEFNPDLVVVAAGFDAAMGDPIGEFVVTPAGYGNMTYLLKGLAQGRLAVCLEGGYDLFAIAQSGLSVSQVLLGARPESSGPISPSKQGAEDVHRVIVEQAKYWESLKSYVKSMA